MWHYKTPARRRSQRERRSWRHTLSSIPRCDPCRRTAPQAKNENVFTRIPNEAQALRSCACWTTSRKGLGKKTASAATCALIGHYRATGRAGLTPLAYCLFFAYRAALAQSRVGADLTGVDDSANTSVWLISHACQRSCTIEMLVLFFLPHWRSPEKSMFLTITSANKPVICTHGGIVFLPKICYIRRLQ